MKKISLVIAMFLLLLSLVACNVKQQYENDAFKEVVVNKSDAGIMVKGKARVFEGVFQYAVKVGDEVLKQDTYHTAGAPAWGDFSIPVDKELANKKGAIIELFVYSAKDGSKINSLEILLNK